MNILWDFDGTIFDTYPVYTDIVYQVMYQNVGKTEIYRNLKKSFSHTIDFYQLSKSQVSEINRLEKLVQPSDTKPFNGVKSILQQANKNVIMTHKDFAGTKAILDAHGYGHYFSDIVTIDDGFPRKPDTAAYEYLHNKHHIDLAIGDRDIDLIPAQKLGIKTCMFQGESQVADFCLPDYQQFDLVKI
ncbi:HAD hydrolase-like protein [Aquisalibacillus elongatus]|uniref:Phosphoglycolate phosphatase n=1 Tax=Aquisalibacillus elongatus TaxID=485577 RepID=A0A3N5B510_9BACI|nr:HAD hydrolase-like protein [Aquisalibacillus elongatus]RPF50650.1 phosphoglycolate phosphatase [Aquisalibacillus elongatus]